METIHPLRDRKDVRVTVRISESDLAALQAQAERLSRPVGAVVRLLIREHLPKKKVAPLEEQRHKNA